MRMPNLRQAGSERKSQGILKCLEPREPIYIYEPPSSMTSNPILSEFFVLHMICKTLKGL